MPGDTGVLGVFKNGRALKIASQRPARHKLCRQESGERPAMQPQWGVWSLPLDVGSCLSQLLDPWEQGYLSTSRIPWNPTSTTSQASSC